MNIVTESKWQRIRYMIAAPLGQDRYYMTACKEHAQLAREAACEGMVLLKNDSNLLPFSAGTKLAIFGKACVDYVKGGGGSGTVRPPYIINLMDGLDSKDVSYYQPLKDYYTDYVSSQYAEDLQPGWLAEPELPQQLVDQARSFTDTAVIVISRYSKEAADRTGSPNDGDFYLSLAEEAMVAKVLSAFDKVAVILNTGGMMDTLWFKDQPKIQSALLVWQPGMEGGNAIADILMGDECPSGRLTDTFAVDFDAYPSSANFNESDMFVEYQEDIYVGYRYFETVPGAAEKVCYPFGYGLSYTDFTITDATWTQEKNLIFSAKVTNVGSCAGKQVVQLYCSAPQGKLGKASKVLVGFEKTEKLLPGASQTVTISVPLSRLASYDDKGLIAKSAWVLERGDYRFFLGENIRSTEELAAAYVVSEDTVLEQLSEKCAPKHLTRRMCADGTYEEIPVSKEARNPYTEGQDPNIPIHWRMQPPQENNWHQVRADMNGPFTRRPFIEVFEGKLTLDEFMADMSTEQLVSLLCGQPNRGPANTFGWGNILEYGVPNAMTCDGPAGLRFMPHIDVKTTNFPCSCQMACTWNRELMYAVGEATATEVRENGCGIWLAPAVNIHRSPLCGRNFEYLSEDPLVSGLMASALIEGVQSMGIAACLKHFACNNKEFNRKDCSSILSERALREIYIKAFEICVREGDQPWAIMSSYNLINGVHASANRELLTDILREEWGYDGVVTTDWFTFEYQYKEIAAGNDIKMATGMPEHTLQMIAEGKLPIEDVRTSAKRVLKLILKLA